MSRKDAQKTFIFRVESKFGTSEMLLSSYKNWRTKISIKCIDCSIVYEQLPSNFLRGSGVCPKCATRRMTEKQTKTHTQFLSEFKKSMGEEYTLLSKYTKAKDKIKVKHNTCNHIYLVEAQSTLRGYGCPKCAYKSVTVDRASEVIKIKNGRDYVILNILDSNTVRIKHVACDSDFNINVTKTKHHIRCPFCKESLGEKVVRVFLEKHSIKFKKQYKTNKCRRVRELPFDFAVLLDGDVLCLIEYDGEQHFKSVDQYGGEQGLEDTQRRDRIKDKYCINHGIPIIRIPYWEFDNIDAILTEKLLPLLAERGDIAS